MKTNKSIIFALVAAFVLGMAMTAGAATIKAVKVKGAIPVDPYGSEARYYRYGSSNDYQSNVAKSTNQVCVCESGNEW